MYRGDWHASALAIADAWPDVAGMPEHVAIRDIATADHAVVLSLNNAATPHVNALDADRFAWLAREADYARLAELDGRVVGFVLAIREGTSYWSANYGWFGARYDRFMYLDRAVVAPTAHRRGVGRALYADLRRFAGERWPRIALEVNLQPPNPVSIAFHEALGFQRVGRRAYDGTEVAMFVLPLTVRPGRPPSP